MISLRKNIITLFMALAVVAVSFAQTPESWKALEKPLNFYLANDLGRNGYYDQKPIAELMGNMAETVDIECVVAAGDVHHFEGVRSVNDPLWMTNYELIYSHPELMIPWYAILGNHEYRGNTQAVIDYSKISARWNMPDRYYTFVMENDGITVRFVMVDTAPLIDKYREDDEYSDACKQDMDKQLSWIDSLLTTSKEDWVLVVGHHPIFAETGKDDSERLDLQKRLDSILRKHTNVDMYLCGHIHNFQHIRKVDSNIDYVVNTSGSLSRKVKPIDGTRFCSGDTGFSLICADKKELNLHMINKEGKVIYTVTRNK
ncbi:metallophosphoesterase [uncultured Bacteroides sp.]|uniref:metallophosphoesterase n=1 Tax=uncultured Bacteroides sp. TaxID=162156 RepID=UPI00263737C2|nr:metallophosphoesterase [uncultured Bacteroides sp.]